MSETDPHRTSATPEPPALAGAATPPAGPTATGPTATGLPAAGRLRPPADREPSLRYRSDPWERLTDGIVELRKRRQVATHRAAGPADPESRLAAMARRAAERAGHPLA